MTTTSNPDRLRVNLAVLAHLTLDGHVARSGAYSASATEYKVNLQGGNGDRMRALAVILGVDAYDDSDGFYTWSGTYRGTRLTLVSTGAPTAPVVTVVEDDALQALAAEVTP